MTVENDTEFKEVANEIATLLCKKNHDYGDSFFDTFKVFGDTSTYIRLSDKLGRLRSLSEGLRMEVSDEGIEDVYRDIAGYCILSLVSKKRLTEGGQS